jgi:hypothetical protein
MRKEPFSVGSYVHIIKRGARGADIVRDDNDRWRFLRLVRYLNDDNVPRNWERDITNEHILEGFSRPDMWDEQAPYVSVLAYCLMDNHFHLLVQEKVEGGISKFMQRLCTSMSLHFNTKYKEKGTLFQGAYKARTVDSDEYLQYLVAYIQVKNPFERYPGGVQNAVREFDAALEWVMQDPFNSLADYLGMRQSALLDHVLVDDIFENQHSFSAFARDVIEGKIERGYGISNTDLD